MNEVTPQIPGVQLVILVMPDGKVGLATNPLDLVEDRITCLGLLEMGKVALSNFHIQKQSSKVQIANQNIMNLLDRNRRNNGG